MAETRALAGRVDVSPRSWGTRPRFLLSEAVGSLGEFGTFLTFVENRAGRSL